MAKKLSRCLIMNNLLSFLAFQVQKKKFLVHETSAQFLNLARPRGRKLLEHETSAHFLSASFNIVCEERAVYICPSTCPVPCFSTELKLRHSFTNRGPRLHVAGGWLVVANKDYAYGLKLIRCPTQAKGSSWLLTNVCLLPQCGSTIVDTQWVVSATCLSESYMASYVHAYLSSHSPPSLPSLGWHFNEVCHR